MTTKPQPAKDPKDAGGAGAAPQEAKSKPAEEPIPSSEGMDILDVLFVLACSIVIVLLIFWAAGQAIGRMLMDQPPAFLVSLANSGTAAFSAIGTTVVLGIIRSMRGRKIQPKYFTYIFRTVVGLVVGTLILATALALLARGKSVAKNLPAMLHLNTDYPSGSTARFIEQDPERSDDVYGELENDPFSKRYRAHITFPVTSPPDFNAIVTRGIPKDGSYQGAQQGYSQMCLRSKGAMNATSKLDIAVECKGKDCVFEKADPDVVVACDASAPKPVSALLSLPVVEAAEKPPEVTGPQESVWNVPTLHTLQTTPNSTGTGYTKFQIELPPNSTLAGYDKFSYQILVNGERVYFDGLPPEVLKEAFHPESANTVSFGLENLNFSGQDRGFEKVTVQLTFYGQNKTLAQKIDLKYVALRPMAETTVAGADMKGPYSTVKWSASYEVPTTRSEYEVFVHSTTDPAEAMKLKSRFDNKSLKMDGRPVVLVVRPPFRHPAYGVVAGITQPSGQIQFTFSESDSHKVCEWVSANVAAAGVGLIKGNFYPYNIYTNKQVTCNAKTH